MKQSGIKVKDKVYFAAEKSPYTVKAFDGRYAICTKPYNLKKTVVYTIIDFKEAKRSTNDLIFNIYDYKVQADIDECLKDLNSGKIGLSRRNSIELDIIKVHPCELFADNHSTTAFAALLLASMLLTGCADVTVVKECITDTPYGFWGGLWHGIIAPFSFFGSLFSDDIAIYAVNNNGGWYDFGFMLGAGILFGGGGSASK